MRFLNKKSIFHQEYFDTSILIPVSAETTQYFFILNHSTDLKCQTISKQFQTILVQFGILKLHYSIAVGLVFSQSYEMKMNFAKLFFLSSPNPVLYTLLVVLQIYLFYAQLISLLASPPLCPQILPHLARWSVYSFLLLPLQYGLLEWTPYFTVPSYIFWPQYAHTEGCDSV